MDKISAACAMDWSIELDKGLRSNNPIRRLEAVAQVGFRLQQWSSEPNITLGVSKIYGLVPGEDRLFANAILLRLADAFRNGDTCIRRAILKIFLVECKRIMKMGRKYVGILAKEKVPNWVELIKRVKVVFDKGDAEAKALALRLLGCWADFTKDSVQIRYMVLLSLRSDNVSEVKAALFAAGCFCRLLEDFAWIVLEMLVGIILMPEMSYGVKLGAVRAFSKMRCSISIANRAYKAGKDLMLCLLQDELKAEMLLSLSKLASSTSILIPQQVELLLTSVNCESTSLLRSKALKCLYFLVAGGASCCTVTERNIVSAMLNVLNDKEVSRNFCFEILQILQKIFYRIDPDLPCLDMPDLINLVFILKNAAQSSLHAERCLAFRLLVSILCVLKITIEEHCSSYPEKWDAAFSELQRNPDEHKDSITHLVCNVVQLITNGIASLMKQMIFLSGAAVTEAKQEFTSLLNLILHLLVEYPSLAHFVVDQLKYLIQTSVRVHCTSNFANSDTCGGLSQDEISPKKHDFFLHPRGPDIKKEESITVEMILCICRFTVSCLTFINETGTISSAVYHTAKSLVEFIRHNRSHSYDSFEVLSLDIHLDVMFSSCQKTDENMLDLHKSKVIIESGFSHNVYWVAQERGALNLTKKMLRNKNNWEAYKGGINACSEGAWFAAAFIFRKLMDYIKSDFNRFWIKSLVSFVGAECEIKLMLFPKVGSEMINRMQNENYNGKGISMAQMELEEYSSSNSQLHGCQVKFAELHRRVCSSKEMLEASGAADGVYYFQRWFLSLRSKVLKIVSDMLELLDSLVINKEQLTKGLEGNGISSVPFPKIMHCVESGFSSLSLRLKNVAKEYDLLALSFMDIDQKSFRNISRQALSSSVLAFCISFAVCFLNSPAYKNASSNKVVYSQNTILKDLIGRLRNLDEKIATELQKLMTISEDSLQSRTETNTSLLIDRIALLVYKHFILGVLRIQEDSKRVKDEDGLNELLLEGIQLLSGIIRRWIEIPCQLPKYFFRVRPCVGAELFTFNTYSNVPDGLTIQPGSQLSLNLSIKLKNVARVPLLSVTNIYCILAVRSSGCLPSCDPKNKQALPHIQAGETEEMVLLFDLLLHRMRKDGMAPSEKHLDVSGTFETTYVCFELNQKGQGFSTCLLDVSALPEGTYPIKWYCCCKNKKGHYWSLLPLNSCSSFTIKRS